MFDPVAHRPDVQLASSIVWFDAFVTNVDRTARNTNMLMWHGRLHLIDHGAALYFHHSWENYQERSRDAFSLIKDHVLLPYATHLQEAHARILASLTSGVIRDIVALIPDALLAGDATFATAQEYRDAYIDYLTRRLAASHSFLEEAIRAHAAFV